MIRLFLRGTFPRSQKGKGFSGRCILQPFPHNPKPSPAFLSTNVGPSTNDTQPVCPAVMKNIDEAIASRCSFSPPLETVYHHPSSFLLDPTISIEETSFVAFKRDDDESDDDDDDDDSLKFDSSSRSGDFDQYNPTDSPDGDYNIVRPPVHSHTHYRTNPELDRSTDPNTNSNPDSITSGLPFQLLSNWRSHFHNSTFSLKDHTSKKVSNQLLNQLLRNSPYNYPYFYNGGRIVREDFEFDRIGDNNKRWRKRKAFGGRLPFGVVRVIEDVENGATGVVSTSSTLQVSPDLPNAMLIVKQEKKEKAYRLGVRLLRQGE